MDILRKVQSICKRLPGIGERQAMRIAYFLASADERYVHDFLEGITELRKNVKRCTYCFALAEQVTAGLCGVCRDTVRDRGVLLIVEKDADRDRFIASRVYQGMYFILGGLAPAVEKDIASHIRLHELLERIEKDTAIQEIILALSLTPDGQRTEDILDQEIRSKTNRTITISRLGKGLSTGTEIEYSDTATLSSALSTRTHK